MKIDTHKLEMQMAKHCVRNIDIAAHEGKTSAHVGATIRNARACRNLMPATVGWIAHGIGVTIEDIILSD